LWLFLGSVMGDVFTLDGYGNIAVITCPYSKGYESYTKYFCKGGYTDCENILKSNGKDSWTSKDRIIMNDDTEQKKLVVTIRDLRMEDAGDYGCGIETTGRDPFTLVHLKVIKGTCCLSFSAYGFYSVFTVDVMKG
uniref:Immunoglobulin V-set domain-containing protein n=1 Tax=Pygocentrus nattereri TaxID=42514 RepID=A0AAR2KV84_PYGNA